MLKACHIKMIPVFCQCSVSKDLFHCKEESFACYRTNTGCFVLLLCGLRAIFTFHLRSAVPLPADLIDKDSVKVPVTFTVTLTDVIDQLL
ncbi:hypothetical protein NQZ68_019034 [Dissostichus eleginoides]|nr:hypothetical protein NQZ68_019034 [Dissostichus eleginoides]